MAKILVDDREKLEPRRLEQVRQHAREEVRRREEEKGEADAAGQLFMATLDGKVVCFAE